MLYKHYSYELKLLYSRSLNFANFVFQKINIENMLASDFFFNLTIQKLSTIMCKSKTMCEYKLI